MRKKISFLLLLSSLIFAMSLINKPKPYRKILSTITFSSLEKKTYQVLKIETEQGISIEIYDLGSLLPKLNSKFESHDHYDGYFILGGTGTNLAMFDIDHDQSPEILAPTFDKNFTSKLDIIKLDVQKNKFYILDAESNTF